MEMKCRKYLFYRNSKRLMSIAGLLTPHLLHHLSQTTVMKTVDDIMHIVMAVSLLTPKEFLHFYVLY